MERGNLVLTRRAGQQITLIQDDREIGTITILRGDCTLAFEAGQELRIVRTEIFDERTELEVVG
jgi:sRNA-binding carbon storage regulator CsrA